ncbi:MAG: MinD/ParA family protein, partial [Actinomycetota bacterium]|nr:MinD/ParA family protein [Actinomycetota bacterium]
SYARPRATAAAITSETMLRPRGQAPESGWRHVVYSVTGGLVNPGPSRQEFERRQLVARVKAPVTGSRRIAVISRKGGVGKTTTTLMLGHTFANLRGDRVIALDANPDAGSLGYRVHRETSATVTDLLDDAEHIRRYADIRAYTSQATTRLEVVASDDDPHISQAIGEQEYHTAVGLLDHHYNLILLDTGTGILDSATKGILGVADQLVIVLAPSLDGARAASLTLDWLMQHGYDGLVANSVAVVNQSRQHGLVELGKLRRTTSPSAAGRSCASRGTRTWRPAPRRGSTTSSVRPATPTSPWRRTSRTASPPGRHDPDLVAMAGVAVGYTPTGTAGVVEAQAGASTAGGSGRRPPRDRLRAVARRLRLVLLGLRVVAGLVVLGNRAGLAAGRGRPAGADLGAVLVRRAVAGAA